MALDINIRGWLFITSLGILIGVSLLLLIGGEIMTNEMAGSILGIIPNLM
jgi:hypothetical protein